MISSNKFIIDYPHQTQYLTKSGSKLVKKSVQDKKIQLIEYLTQNELLKTGVVPLANNYSEEFFLEEFIEGKQVKDLELTDNVIKMIAEALKKIHSITPSVELRNLLSRDLNNDGRYHPLDVFETMIREAGDDIINKVFDIGRIRNYLRNIEDKLNSKKYRLSIIHGDLSVNNIILSNQRIKIIDWTDVRYDIATADISQLFYLLSLDNRQQNLFLSNYSPEYIFDDLLTAHKLLLLIYDLINISNTQKYIDINLQSEITRTINHEIKYHY